VLTETRSGKVDGVQATRLIKDEFPEIAVLVLTENLNDSTSLTPYTPVQGDTSSSKT